MRKKKREYLKKKKEKFDLKKQYGLAWEFLKELRSFLIIALLIFLLFAFVGFLFPIFFVEEILKYIQELITITETMGFSEMFVFIFFNNLGASFFALISGAFLGLFPIIALILNGYVLGFVARKSVDIAGSGILLRLLPHGVFELPAIIISIALGIRLGMFVFSKKQNLAEEFVYRLKNSLKVFLLIIFPLLIIAAIIEAGLIALFA